VRCSTRTDDLRPRQRATRKETSRFGVGRRRGQTRSRSRHVSSARTWPRTSWAPRGWSREARWCSRVITKTEANETAVSSSGRLGRGSRRDPRIQREARRAGRSRKPRCSIAEGEMRETSSVWKRSSRPSWRRGRVASRLRRTSPGRARASQSRRHGPAARQEMERGATIEASLRLGAQCSNAEPRPGSRASVTTNRVLRDTPRVHASSHRLQIS
jgi:hypothetical protein